MRSIILPRAKGTDMVTPLETNRRPTAPANLHLSGFQNCKSLRSSFGDDLCLASAAAVATERKTAPEDGRGIEGRRRCSLRVGGDEDPDLDRPRRRHNIP